MSLFGSQILMYFYESQNNITALTFILMLVCSSFEIMVKVLFIKIHIPPQNVDLEKE